MKLRKEFNPFYEEIINTYEPLEGWFERNQDLIVEYGLTSKGNTNYEFVDYPNDIKVLGRMTDAAYTWFDMPEYVLVTNEEKALYASMAMERVYERELNRLNDVCKEEYYISTGKLHSDHYVEGISYRKERRR